VPCRCHACALSLLPWATTWQIHGKDNEDMAKAWRRQGKNMAKKTWQRQGKSMAKTWQRHGKDRATNMAKAQ
jgi:hypothetical protein